MGKIKVMSESLSNKIAAGEVVEKVSSVVKELVENSIDAGSNIIEVSLVDAGIKEIKVIDNGKGMDKEDALLCFSPHATSKIRNENDLFFINTLGFRGEALPSIASVSDVFLDTSDGSYSTLVHIKGGKLESNEVGTVSKGTKIIVRDLFFNTPARLKFLKSYYTELNGVVSLIEKLSLSHPNISFKLSSDNKELIKTSGSNDLLKTIYEIYGYNVSKNMVYIEGHNDDYDINGYVSNINITKSTKKDMITLVNGRIVNNSYVNRIIKDAYHTYLAVDKYPIVVINILVDPTIVDVNIHPTKQDIKFGKMETLEELLFSLIRDKLMNINNMFKAYDETKYEVSNSEEYVLNDNLVVKEEYDKPVIEESKMCFNMNEESSGYETVIDTLEVKNEKPSLLHPIGLAMGTYLFATDEECVYMIDIHAANERINYEKLLNALKESVVHKTSMLFPITIEFTKNEFMTIMEKKDFITNLGISFDEFGVNTIRVYEHPTYFREGYEEESLRRVFDLIVSIDKDFDRVKFNEQLAINLSCKMSVKANTFIGSLEQETLLKRLFECEFPYTCPHGRPTIIKYTKYELEKLFKRVNG
ncbi:dNA mismatch repair protein MutL [Clostridium sp. CAG:628]|nr:dNA mismatch repair protein MutL [Clostridium sp. CAG:628]